MRIRRSYRQLASWLHEGLRVLWVLWLVGASVFTVAVPLLVAFGPPTAILAVPAAGAPDARPPATQVARDGTGVEVRATELVVTVRGASRAARGLAYLPALIYGALWGLVIHRMKALTARLEWVSPFTVENGRRLVQIGLALLASEVVVAATTVASVLYVRSLAAVSDGTIAWGLDPDLATLTIGVLLVVVGEAFRLGAVLQDEYDATV